MKINTALILCAGLGKRLNPLTLDTPKPLIKLNSITILENCINTIIKIGVKRVILNTFHLVFFSKFSLIKFFSSLNILFLFILIAIRSHACGINLRYFFL